ncbi:hypothetical protein ACLKA6_012010 [Drosophila palustris]
MKPSDAQSAPSAAQVVVIRMVVGLVWSGLVDGTAPSWTHTRQRVDEEDERSGNGSGSVERLLQFGS